MATRLILLCSGATASNRTAAFPDKDESLDEGGQTKATQLRLSTPRSAVVFASPWRVAGETATLVGLAPEYEPLIADIDRGRWVGRSLADIQESDGESLTAWFGNPAGATPGGETMEQVVARIAPWMELMSAADAVIVAVTHAAVIRAAIAHALQIPVKATLNIDIAPLSKAILSFNRLWRLQALGG